MGANPILGVIYHWTGGFASATNFIPFRGIKRWSWEIYWLIQGIAAWIDGIDLHPEYVRNSARGISQRPAAGLV